MTISSWLQTVGRRIARRDAEWLLAQRLGVDRSFLVLHGDDELKLRTQLDDDVRRRVAGEPLALILGEQEFYGRKFWLGDGAVLIPRPESEAIVDLCKELNPKAVLDVGTGSGCLAISVALELPDAQVEASDLDERALAVAKKNARRLGAEISWRQADLLQGWQGKLPELVMANLPYVDRNWDWLDDKALSFEPQTALFAEQGGLELIKRLIDQIAAYGGGKWLLLEADPSQHESIIDYAALRGLKHEQTRGYILLFSLV